MVMTCIITSHPDVTPEDQTVQTRSLLTIGLESDDVKNGQGVVS